jgi:hypothetical protein
MRSGKAPSHIPLPPPPNDVFSASALDDHPSSSGENSGVNSPTSSPFHRGSSNHAVPGHHPDSQRRKASTRSHGQTFARGPRHSFASGAPRRMSRNSWVDSTRSRKGLFSPSFGHHPGDEEGLEDEMKPAIPSLAVGIRPAYSTPLPLLPMIVLCIVSLPLADQEKQQDPLMDYCPTRSTQAMLSEFLSANTPTPFVLKMVEGTSSLVTTATPAHPFHHRLLRSRRFPTHFGHGSHRRTLDRQPRLSVLHHPVFYEPLVVVRRGSVWKEGCVGR